MSKKMKRLLSGVLCLMLAFSLIHPGLASAEVTYTCGLEEHTHGEDCYDMLPEQRTVRTLACGFDIEAAYAAAQGETADFVVHAHEDACFGEDGSQICPLKEILPHEHAAECYAPDMAPLCGQEEGADHSHTDSCALICGKEEIILHTHELETCYAAAEPAAEGEDQPAAEEEPVLTCTVPAVYEHIHDDSCFTETVEEVEVKTLICKLSEHTHDKTCEAEEEEEPEAPAVTEEPAATTESTESTEGESVYEAYLQTLAALEQQVKAYLALSPEAANFAAQEIALYENLDKIEARLWSDLSAAVLTMEEFTELNDEFARISDLLYVDFEPEEEMRGYDYPVISVSDWFENGGKWKVQYNGSYLKNTWIVYNNNYYYIGADEYMCIGWIDLGGVWYYLEPTDNATLPQGAMYTGTHSIGGVTYDFGTDGAIKYNYGPADGSGNNSNWDYYWSGSNIWSNGTDLKSTYYRPYVDKSYADLVLGAKSADFVTCSTSVAGSPSQNAVYTYVLDANAWGAGLQDCIGQDANAVVSARHGVGYGNDYANIVSGNFYVVYHNIGTYNGQTVCLKLSLVDYAIPETTLSIPRIGFTVNQGMDGSEEYVKEKCPGVSVTDIAWVTVQYDFYEHDNSSTKTNNCCNTRIEVKGSTSYYDVDNYQGLHLAGGNTGIVATNDCVLKYGKPNNSSDNFIYFNSKDDNSIYTTKHAFTEEFQASSFQRTYSFTDYDEADVNAYPDNSSQWSVVGNGGIYHDASPVAPVTETAKIRVKKVVSDANGSVSFPFTASYTLKEANVSLGTFNLKHNETKEFTVPVGAVVSVTETNSGNYTVDQRTKTHTVNNAGINSNTVTFTNTRQNGSVTIRKLVSNSTYNPYAEFTFEAKLKNGNQYIAFPNTVTGGPTSGQNSYTFNLKNNGTVTISGLPVGTTLEVTEKSGDSSYRVSAPNQATQTIAVSATGGTLTFNNTLQGKLTVKKVIAGPTDGSSFTINTTVGTDNKSESFSYNAAKTYGPYDAGTSFTVAESAAYGYQISYSPSATGAINNTTQTVTVTNKGLTTSVSIPISKTLVNPDNAERKYTFKLEPMKVGNVTAPGNEQTITLDATGGSNTGAFIANLDTSHLKVGTVSGNQKTMKYYYKVSESTQSVDGTLAADSTWYKVEVTLTGTVGNLKAEVTNIQKKGSGNNVGTASFTNTLLGSLKVKKVVSGTDGSFPITVTLSGPAYKSGQTYSYKVDGQNKSGTANSSNQLVIDLSLSHNQFATITGVPYGSYVVEEQVPPGYAVSYDNNKSGNLTIGTANPVETVVTNTEKTAEVKLKVQKNMAYPDKLNDNTFTFDLTVPSTDTNNESQSKTVTVEQGSEQNTADLFVLNYKGSQLDTAGTATFEYTIKEQVTSTTDHILEDDTVQTVKVELSQNPTSRELIATVTPDSNQVSFNNVLNGNLTIVKDVIPIDGHYAENKAFIIDSGIADETVLSLTDKDDHSQSSSNTYTKPIGTQFEVVEELVYGYQTSYNVEGKAVEANETTTSVDKVTGKIAVGDTTVTVTNQELSTTLDVPITKHVTNPDNKERTYSFTIEALDGAPGLVGADEQGKKVVQVTVFAGNETGTTTFDDLLKYSGRDLAGEETKTFQYKITENATEDKLNQYDEAKFIMSVTLTHTGDRLAGTNEDENKDALVTSVSYTKDQEAADSISFTNTTLGSLKIIKDLNLLNPAEDADKAKNREFVFDIEIISKDYVVGNEYLSQIAESANLSNGTDAGKITVTQTIQASHNEDGYVQIDGIPVNSEFKVTERLSSSFGYETTYKVNTENLLTQIFSDDTLPAAGVITAYDKSEIVTVTVTNTEMETSETVSITKDIVNPDGNERRFFFKLIETDDKGGVKAGGVTRKVQIDMKDDEIISFDPIPYRGIDLEDTSARVDGGKKTRDYYYKVFEIDQTAYASDTIEDETIADNKEVDSDQDHYLVKVTLTATLNKLEAHVVEVIDADGKKVMADAEKPLLKPDFQNTILGSLTVKKSIYGGDANDNFKFQLKTADWVNGAFEYEKNGVATTLTFTDGVAEFHLRDGESLTLYGLPHGLEVQVHEVGTDKYVAYHKVNSSITREGQTVKVNVESKGTTVKYINYEVTSSWLPQTGQLKWPVLVLAALGIGFMGFGFLTRKRKKNGK